MVRIDLPAGAVSDLGFRISASVSLIALALVLGTAAASPAATRVYAQVNAETAIYAGEDFTYTIVVEGGGKPSKIDLAPLAAFNPRQAGGPQEMNISINGRAMSTFSVAYAITAGQPGVMHLPAVTVVVDGRTYTTDPVDVTISRPGTTDRMSVECQISDKECYVGQPLVMTVRWIITAPVQQGVFNVPVFQSDDFYLEDVSEPTTRNVVAGEQTTIHGVPVTVTEERQVIRGTQGAILSFRKVLIPKHAGRIRLDPLTVSANLAVGRERTDDFFNPIRTRFQRVSVQSEPVELEVRPLPQTGKPPEFYGLVGRYTIAATATPTQVNVGDPITLTIRIGGNPFLKPVQWPALEQMPELATNFKIPAEKASPVVEAGSKVFTQTLRANSDKVTQIPAIPLAFFDPDKGGYVVAKTDPIKLQVAPTKVLTNMDVEGTASAAPVNREVEAIRKGLSANYYGPEVLENQDLSVLAILSRPLDAALWSISLLVLVVSAVVKLARRTSPEALARKRRRRAAPVALAQLKSVASAEPEQKHEVLLAALKGYIGDRFDKVAASLTAEDCSRTIAEATDDAAAATRFKELIEICEAARYTPLQAKIGPDQVQAASKLIESAERAAGRRIADSRRRSSSICNPQSPIRNRVGGSSLLLLTLCFALGPAVKASPALGREQLYAVLQEANTVFQQANAAGNPDTAKPLYDKAILLYEKLINQGGVHNAKLYYNLANAYLLKDDLGRAILNYRRAAKLDRGDLNIQKNLAFARTRKLDRVETSTEKRVLGTLFFWHYDFSRGTKLLLASVFFAILCVSLTGALWTGGTLRLNSPKADSGNPRSAIRNPQWPVWLAALCGVLLVGLLTSVFLETRREAAVRPGVITAAEVVARQGDGPNYPPSFKDALHAGLEFDLLEQRPGWLHIRLADGTDAWIPDETAGLV